MVLVMKNNRLNLLNSIPVLVLSTGYEPLFSTNWKKAISAVVGGRAEIVEVQKDLYINAGENSFPFPKIVRYLSGVLLGKLKKYCTTPRPSKKNLWLRDKGQCQYCLKKVTVSSCTIDHVVPKSKGGKHEWKNIALACAKCNQKKGATLLKDTNMKLAKIPHVPDGPELLKI